MTASRVRLGHQYPAIALALVKQLDDSTALTRSGLHRAAMAMAKNTIPATADSQTNTVLPNIYSFFKELIFPSPFPPPGGCVFDKSLYILIKFMSTNPVK